MAKIINVCSGKGGVGKTSVTINLAAALHSLNKRVVIIDGNLTTSHIGLMFGMYSTEKTFNSFLRGESSLADAVHVHHSGLHMIPAALDLNELHSVPDNIKDVLKEKLGYYDFALIDSAPGVGREALLSLRACDEALFIANPYIPSVVDILKIKNLSGKIGFYNAGLVINRSRNRSYELAENDIFRFTEMHIVGSVPEDENIQRSVNSRKIPFFEYPKSPSSVAFSGIAHGLAGFPYPRRR